MAEYNGHRSWNAWNISLWIGNDEGLYREAVYAIHQTKSYDRAVDLFFRRTGLEGEKTPDGGIYNRTCVREALVGLEVDRRGRAEGYEVRRG